MNNNATPLQGRIARALYENAEYYGPEDAQPPWDSRDDEERGEWMKIAAAVLPILRAAQADAWDEGYYEATVGDGDPFANPHRHETEA